jgi:hypothetical protein
MTHAQANTIINLLSVIMAFVALGVGVLFAIAFRDRR